MIGEKVKVILEKENGEVYEIDALSVRISYSMAYHDFMEYEINLVGIGDMTTGLKRSAVLCCFCGNEWKSDERGGCSACGAWK